MRPWVRRGVVLGGLGALVALALVAWTRRRRPTPVTGTTAPHPAPAPTPAPTPTPAPAPAPAPVVPDAAWVEPADDGTCPVSHPIKGKVRTGIFHPPGAFAYERTHADRCYRDAAAAEADGLRAAKR